MGQRNSVLGNHIAEYGLALALVAVFAIPAVTYLGDMIGENLKSYKKEDSAHLAGMLDKDSWAKIKPHDREEGNGAELGLYYATQGIDPLMGHSDLFNNAESVTYYRDANGQLIVEVDGQAVNTMSGNGHLEVLYASMGELEEVLVSLAEELNEPDLLDLVRSGHALGNAQHEFDQASVADQARYRETGEKCQGSGKKMSCSPVNVAESKVRTDITAAKNNFESTYFQVDALLAKYTSMQQPGTRQSAYLGEVRSMVQGYSQIISAVTYDRYYSGKGEIPGELAIGQPLEHKSDEGGKLDAAAYLGGMKGAPLPPSGLALSAPAKSAAASIDLSKSSSEIVHQSSEGIRNAPEQAANNNPPPGG